jgi:hypothetical protein
MPEGNPSNASLSRWNSESGRPSRQHSRVSQNITSKSLFLGRSHVRENSRDTAFRYSLPPMPLIGTSLLPMMEVTRPAPAIIATPPYPDERMPETVVAGTPQQCSNDSRSWFQKQMERLRGGWKGTKTSHGKGQRKKPVSLILALFLFCVTAVICTPFLNIVDFRYCIGILSSKVSQFISYGLYRFPLHRIFLCRSRTYNPCKTHTRTSSPGNDSRRRTSTWLCYLRS